MSNPTKAPWIAKQFTTYEEHGWVVLWPDKAGTHMRRVDHQGIFTGADAALISAAPDLLDACERLIAWCNEETPPTGEGVYFVRLARAAVAKARRPLLTSTPGDN